MLNTINREAKRRAAELEASKALKARRREAVTNSNARVKDLKQRRVASKRTITRLKKDYERAKGVLNKLYKQASTPRRERS